MKAMKRIIVLICLLTIAATVNAQTEIKLNLVKGKTYSLGQQSTINSNMEMLGQKIVYGISMNARANFKIIDINDGVYNMEVHFADLSLKVKNPFSNLNIGSEEEAEEFMNKLNEMMNKGLSALKNIPFTIRISNRGEIMEVSGFEKLFENMLQTMSSESDMDVQYRQGILEQIKKVYGEDATRNSFATMFDIYPENKVSIGDGWSKKRGLQNEISAEYEMRYRLEKVSKSKIVITGNGKFNKNSQNIQEEDMKGSLNTSGEFDVSYDLDPVSGWVKNATINNEININTNTEPDKNMQEGMSMSIRIQSETHLN